MKRSRESIDLTKLPHVKLLALYARAVADHTLDVEEDPIGVTYALNKTGPLQKELLRRLNQISSLER